jgi:hypothetical protein
MDPERPQPHAPRVAGNRPLGAGEATFHHEGQYWTILCLGCLTHLGLPVDLPRPSAAGTPEWLPDVREARRSPARHRRPVGRLTEPWPVPAWLAGHLLQ